MDPHKRVLIVEPDRGFALSLASLFQEAGCATRTVLSAAEAELEIATRRPGLCVVRAELPDLSGFSLCAQLRHDPVTSHLPVILYSSDTAPESLAEHARTPWAANGYLAMPLDTAALRMLAERILNAPEPPESADDAVIIDEAELIEEAAPGDADVRAPSPEPPRLGSLPPPVPKRPRRTSLTEDDRLFVSRAFQSVAERRDVLVEEAHQLRPPLLRELLKSPEGRAEALREDLHWREAQIARLSEVWEVRERELELFDERMHEKDVELAGMKGRLDDLLHRLASARDLFVKKEEEYGASVDSLLLEKFSQEKELIEVVASNERRIHQLERELRKRDDDLAERRIALDAAQAEIGRLEEQMRELARSAADKEAELTALIARGEGELQREKTLAKGKEEELKEALARAGEERQRLEQGAREAAALLSQRVEEREATIALRESQLGTLEAEFRQHREGARAREDDLAREVKDHLQQITGLEAELDSLSRELAETEAEGEAELGRREAAHLAEREEREREANEALLAERTRAEQAERSRLELEEGLEMARQEARRTAEDARSAQEVFLAAREEERTRAQGRLSALSEELTLVRSREEALDLERSSALARAQSAEEERARGEEAFRAAEAAHSSELEQTRTALEGALAERDEARLAQDRSRAEIQRASAHAGELERRLEAASEEAGEARSRAEARVEELSARVEQLGREASLAERARARVQELEGMLSSAAQARARAEQELSARVVAAEGRAAEAARRLDATTAERREAEARLARTAEAAKGRFEEELTRRETARALEVQRLEAALEDLSRRERALSAELLRQRPPATPNAFLPKGEREG